MKKPFFIACSLTIFLLLLGLSYGCQDSLLDISQPTLEERQQAIDDAKKMYATQTPEAIQTRAAVSGPTIRVKPEWKYVTVQKDMEYMVVEVAIKTEYNYYFMTPEAKALALEQKDTRYKQSQTRMVFLTNQKTQETDIFMMTIVPDVSYLEQTQFKPFRKISYLKRGDNFSGFIFYQDMEGYFVNGWKYTNGTVTHTMSVADGEKPEVEILPTRSDDCTDYYLEWNVEVCGSWEVNGEYSGSECYNYNEYSYWYTHCSGGGSGGYDEGGGGGGGSSSSSGNSAAHKISAGAEVKTVLDKVVKEKLLECAFQHMNSWNIKFSDVVLNPSSEYPGYFNHVTEVYTVRNAYEIAGTFPEEYIHAFQQEMYAGIGKYSGVGRANIEFEAKLIQDIACVYTGAACPKWGAGKKYEDQYPRWIIKITDDGMKNPDYNEIYNSSFNGLTYWDFLEDYVSEFPEYNKGIDKSLEPNALRELSTHFKCE